MKRHLFYSKFLRKDDGSTIIEFAVVAPVFFLLFFGVIEFGLYTYHQMAIERIAVEVSRIAAIGKIGDNSGCPASTVGSDSDKQLAYIVCVIKTRAAGLINGDKMQVQVNTLAAGGTTIPVDICLDTTYLPSSEPSDCKNYEDVNVNGKYDGSASNAGLRGQIIEVRISYPWVVLFPIMDKYFGSAGHEGISLVTSSTVIKNEPF